MHFLIFIQISFSILFSFNPFYFMQLLKIIKNVRLIQTLFHMFVQMSSFFFSYDFHDFLSSGFLFVDFGLDIVLF